MIPRGFGPLLKANEFERISKIPFLRTVGAGFAISIASFGILIAATCSHAAEPSLNKKSSRNPGRTDERTLSTSLPTISQASYQESLPELSTAPSKSDSLSEGYSPSTNDPLAYPQIPQDDLLSDRVFDESNWLADSYRSKADFFESQDDFAWHLGGLGRAFYLNDQRYEFTGVEASIGVQGVIEGGVRRNEGDWELIFDTQFFLNQPFDRNFYTHGEFGTSFQSNFQYDPFEISQLYISARKNNFMVQAGRIVTPFGRFYYPLHSNQFWDSPFIRGEAISYRETGLLLQWDPEPFIVTGAITNGGFNQDTNSSKAFIGRVGLQGDSYAVGASVKVQDGIGSENQKQCNSHIGVDAMYRWGRWILSGEAIVDYYGMNRPGLDPLDITWGRSVYFRDQNQNVAHPLTGYGYYVDLGYMGDRWSWNFNYGDYIPQKIGDSRQDITIHRALIKGTWHATPNLDLFGVQMLEDSVRIAPGRTRTGFGLMIGLEYSL